MIFLDSSINLFKDLSQPDSIVVLLYLCAAFLLGGLTIWLSRKKEITRLKNAIIKQTEDFENYKSKNEKLDSQFDLQNGNSSDTNSSNPHIVADLNLQVTELKQANFYLKKDYDLALEALQSAKAQAEEMQISIKGTNILPQMESSEDIIAARDKIKTYLRDKLDQQTAGLTFKTELSQKIGEEQVSPVDHLDEAMVLVFAELIP